MDIPTWAQEIRVVGFDYTNTLTTVQHHNGTPDDTVTRPVDPRAAQTLHALRDRGYSLALASNTVPERPRSAALVAADVAEVFKVVLQSHDLGYAKPALEFWVALAVDAKPREILYVGDHPDTDVAGACASGMRAALVDQTGQFPVNQTLPDGAVRIGHVHDLLTLLPAGGPR